MSVTLSTRMKKSGVGTLTVLALGFSLLACDSDEDGEDLRATAKIQPTGAADSLGQALAPAIGGTLTFKPEGAGLRVSGHLTGLPAGAHGFHVHALGNCADTGKAAGPHFDPDSAKHHAHPDTAHRHAGDMGNITANGASEAHVDTFIAGLMLEGAKSVKGKAVIVHAKRDDGMTQPTGDSGARIGCGIIE